MSDPAQDKPLSLFVERRIEASRDRVFQIWTDPEMIKIWFGGRETPVDSVSLDLRQGGHYSIVFREPDGRRSEVSGEFIEVAVPSRLVYTWRMKSGPSEMLANTVTVEFLQDGSATRLRLEHAPFDDPELREQHLGGWQVCLDTAEFLI